MKRSYEQAFQNQAFQNQQTISQVFTQCFIYRLCLVKVTLKVTLKEVINYNEV